MKSNWRNYDAFVDAAQALNWSEPELVIRVIDGDTLITADATGVKRIRLAAIDAPELQIHGCPAEPYSSEAKSILEMLCLHEHIELALDPMLPPRDCYDRWLYWARVSTTGPYLNALMLLFGAARLRADFPTSAHTLLEPLQKRARDLQVGMWSRYRKPEPLVSRSGSMISP